LFIQSFVQPFVPRRRYPKGADGTGLDWILALFQGFEVRLFEKPIEVYSDR
jgi:hypothetical protein